MTREQKLEAALLRFCANIEGAYYRCWKHPSPHCEPADEHPCRFCQARFAIEPEPGKYVIIVEDKTCEHCGWIQTEDPDAALAAARKVMG